MVVSVANMNIHICMMQMSDHMLTLTHLLTGAFGLLKGLCVENSNFNNMNAVKIVFFFNSIKCLKVTVACQF